MSKLQEVLADLCAEKGISIYRMCKDLGMQPSIISDLKAGRRKGVNAETAEKIATYFNVSVSFLLGKAEREEDIELAEYLEELKNRKEMRMLFSLAKGATKADVEQAVKIIEALKNT